MSEESKTPASVAAPTGVECIPCVDPTPSLSAGDKQRALMPFASRKFDWLDDIAHDECISSTAFRVAFIICQHVNKNKGTAWPSQETIAAEAHITRRSVGSCVKSLKVAGYLAVQYRGPSQTALYRMSLPTDRKNSSHHGRKERAYQTGDRSEENFLSAGNVSGNSPSSDQKNAVVLVGSKLPTEHLNEHNYEHLKKSRAIARATRWPEDGIVPDDWREEARAARAQFGLPPVDIDLEAEMFANYWSAKAGAGATKLDWKKTWINWAVKANGNRNGQFNKKSAHDGLIDAGRRALEILKRERESEGR